ncbi:helix-turn-helix transcriptional regulator [Roseitalea porphyridii]|uniref:DNA-binding protein n=1 Tax=Roseitalea porphyridii TaxID=1852022 RepID=A0A4P6V0U1_9HYPH|nr:helix-turn-helix domain-containing protein [Roseitalea porphyridii]QBK30146.1 DNA-binding protein [Roseitalea porphyridii]
MTDNQRYLRAKEAARYLGVSNSVLAKMRMRGDGPPYRKFGSRVVLYVRSELDDWLENDCKAPTENA